VTEFAGQVKKAFLWLALIISGSIRATASVMYLLLRGYLVNKISWFWRYLSLSNVSFE